MNWPPHPHPHQMMSGRVAGAGDVPSVGIPIASASNSEASDTSDGESQCPGCMPEDATTLLSTKTATDAATATAGSSNGGATKRRHPFLPLFCLIAPNAVILSWPLFCLMAQFRFPCYMYSFFSTFRGPLRPRCLWDWRWQGVCVRVRVCVHDPLVHNSQRKMMRMVGK